MRKRESIENFYKILPNGCWEWVRAKDSCGYGVYFTEYGLFVGAHKYVYELHKGTVPRGLELDHIKTLCQLRSCVNPDHLEPVTHLENVRRGSIATKTHCKNGHEFTKTTTSITKRGRICLVCRRNVDKERYANKRISKSLRSNHQAFLQMRYGRGKLQTATTSNSIVGS